MVVTVMQNVNTKPKTIDVFGKDTGIVEKQQIEETKYQEDSSGPSGYFFFTVTKNFLSSLKNTDK